jgi:hypothetical protein
MQSIPKGKSAGPKNAQIPINRAICPQFAGRVNRLAPRPAAEYASLWFGCHSSRHGDRVFGNRQTFANAHPGIQAAARQPAISLSSG